MVLLCIDPNPLHVSPILKCVDTSDHLDPNLRTKTVNDWSTGVWSVPWSDSKVKE